MIGRRLSLSVVSGSHVVPSGYTGHRPVAGSQVPAGTMHGLFGDPEHPTAKQSPTTIWSRAKSPVKLDPEMYLVTGRGRRQRVVMVVDAFQPLAVIGRLREAKHRLAAALCIHGGVEPLVS